ncbi:U1 small nuclear ribonucleoprotein 70 kDa homolog [[Candida] anglica]|uniref:U1 small nuclear ribonucleoprotein 70 kDa homolog n=1 Tax=[Candida] anglica TaxID=148631 RepID=A0ABP0EGX4_9ASCO
MSDPTSKYPPTIQKLFAPKLPLQYKAPLDYPVETRKTHYISPISSLKAQYTQYVTELHQKQVEEEKLLAENGSKNEASTQQINAKRSIVNKKRHRESFERQLKEWNDPELLQKNEREFMKDPYRTVFIARLPYELTELDISKSFGKYGMIESIRIIRAQSKSTTATPNPTPVENEDGRGRSRGYGFVVFERESDATACVRELAPVGLKIGGTSRTILVDIERGRLSRSWKPRRLGGGVGGRHYTKPNALHSNNASAAASGRRLHLSNNPYAGGRSGGSHHGSSGSSSYHQSRRGPVSGAGYHGSGSYGGNGGASTTSTSFGGAPLSTSPAPQAAYSYTSRSGDSRTTDSVRDKYSKYATSTSRTQDRSIRSIRGQRE